MGPVRYCIVLKTRCFCNRGLFADSLPRHLRNLQGALKNMPEMEERPQELKGEIFDLLFNSAEINKFAPKERSEYIKQMITIRDIVNQMATAEEKGEARGLAKGRAEGEANAMRKMAVKMLSAGEKVSRVSELTGLPLEEVTALQEG